MTALSGEAGELVERLRGLVILDEVLSDNPLGREAADFIRRQAEEIARLTKQSDLWRRDFEEANAAVGDYIHQTAALTERAQAAESEVLRLTEQMSSARAKYFDWGITFAITLLANILGVEEWQMQEGSGSQDQDAGDTIRHVLDQADRKARADGFAECREMALEVIFQAPAFRGDVRIRDLKPKEKK